MANYAYNQNTVTITFDKLPQLQPEIIETKNLGWWQRFNNARKPRKYTLTKDWCINITGISPTLDGTIVVPSGAIIDGASIPFPWFIAFITFGILRPMGILLTATLPHDYAFDTGKLLYQTNEIGKFEQRIIKRHDADSLFYHIIKIANQAPITASISWLSVRFGWYWIPYNGKYRGGRFPMLITLLLLNIIAVGIYCFTK